MLCSLKILSVFLLGYISLSENIPFLISLIIPNPTNSFFDDIHLLLSSKSVISFLHIQSNYETK